MAQLHAVFNCLIAYAQGGGLLPKCKQHPSIPALGMHCSYGSDYKKLFSPYKGVNTGTLLVIMLRKSILTEPGQEH